MARRSLLRTALLSLALVARLGADGAEAKANRNAYLEWACQVVKERRAIDAAPLKAGPDAERLFDRMMAWAERLEKMSTESADCIPAIFLLDEAGVFDGAAGELWSDALWKAATKFPSCFFEYLKALPEAAKDSAFGEFGFQFGISDRPRRAAPRDWRKAVLAAADKDRQVPRAFVDALRRYLAAQERRK